MLRKKGDVIRVLTLRLILLPPFILDILFYSSILHSTNIKAPSDFSDAAWECGSAYDDALTLYRSLTRSLIFKFLVTVAASVEWVLYLGGGILVNYLR